MKEIQSNIKLKVGRWYLIKDLYVYSKTKQKIVAGKYLGKSISSKSFELCIPIKHPSEHNGICSNGNSGKLGYCVYLTYPKIIRKLTRKEMFLEQI
jgi:hypothetical protein